MDRNRSALLLLLALVGAVWVANARCQASDPFTVFDKSFANPPDDSRVMVRWWWFGAAVTKPELRRELEQMKAAGIGGAEIATLYPQALDDPATGFRNLPYLSPEYLDDLHFAAEEAARLGLRVDITLGSGWPLGGPHIPVTQAAGMLRVNATPVAAGEESVPVPSAEAGEELLSTFVQQGTGDGAKPADAKPVADIREGRLYLPESDAPRTALFFFSSRTGMTVKRPAVGAEGFVLDHYDKQATEAHLRAVGDKLLSAFGDHPPYAVFSDSLEDYGSDWTPRLLEEFRNRRGYDLLPHLPALLGDATPETAGLRRDWGRTLTELADDNFLQPIHAWAQQHHTLFRSQAYGFPPVTLSSNRYADLPEGEGKATLSMWRAFSDTRWAASAGHLFGHPVISSETWTWLHSAAFRATPLDMKAEADLHFLQGINQLVGHGWPYSPPDAAEPGWRMYAAAALDAHNPWFPVMPDVMKYLQRVSYALRQGRPQNDVALLLPNDDVWASFRVRYQHNRSATSALGFDETGSNVTIDEQMGKFLGDKVIPQVLDAGYNLDFVDADAIDSVGIPYKVLLLPGVDRIPLETYRKIAAFARRGGIVVATRRMPATAPGYLHAREESAQIAQLSKELFAGAVPTAHFVSDENLLGPTLNASLPSDITLTPRTPDIGFIHRKLDNGDLYFIANTGNQPRHVQVKFRAEAKYAESWDPFSGKVEAIAHPEQLDLEPYESRLIMFSDQSGAPAENLAAKRRVVQKIDLSREWRVSFTSSTGKPQGLTMKTLHSWDAEPRLTYYSGTAIYERSFDLTSRPGVTTELDFGEGTPLTRPPLNDSHNMQAYLDSPVREAARVYVNDTLAGYVWHPPYQVDVSRWMKAGRNQLRIEVSNTAINELAGRALPDYRLLYDRYGTRFEPQDMLNLKPLPSGLLGPVTLVQSTAK